MFNLVLSFQTEFCLDSILKKDHNFGDCHTMATLSRHINVLKIIIGDINLGEDRPRRYEPTIHSEVTRSPSLLN